jgi:hypothetical protein
VKNTLNRYHYYNSKHTNKKHEEVPFMDDREAMRAKVDDILLAELSTMNKTIMVVIIFRSIFFKIIY